MIKEPPTSTLLTPVASTENGDCRLILLSIDNKRKNHGGQIRTDETSLLKKKNKRKLAFGCFYSADRD